MQLESGKRKLIGLKLTLMGIQGSFTILVIDSAPVACVCLAPSAESKKLPSHESMEFASISISASLSCIHPISLFLFLFPSPFVSDHSYYQRLPFLPRRTVC